MVDLQEKFKLILTQTHLFQKKMSSGAKIMTSYLLTKLPCSPSRTKIQMWISDLDFLTISASNIISWTQGLRYRVALQDQKTPLIPLSSLKLSMALQCRPTERKLFRSESGVKPTTKRL